MPLRTVDHAQLPESSAAAAELLQSWLGLARVSGSCGLAGDSPAEPPRSHRQLMQAPAPANSTRAPPPAPTPAAAIAVSSAPPTGGSDTAPTNSTGANNSTAAGALAELQQGSPGGAHILGSQNPTANLTAAQARVLCALQVEVGPCRGSLPRWAYNVVAGACQQFVWGGCDGNGNNFVSADTCEATCGAIMTDLAGNATPGAPSSNASEPSPAPVLAGPVDTTLEPERMLARVEEITPAAAAAPTPVPPRTSSARQQRSRAGRLLRAVAAGTMGALAVLLL